MKLDEYQKKAMRTCQKPDLVNVALGAAGEAGEMADLVKKHIFQGHGLEHQKLINEAGDVLWYLAQLAEVLGVPLSYIAEQNILKLQHRYPEGFDAERSRNRGG